MLVAQPDLKVGDDLAEATEAKVAGFDDPRVDRTHGNLMHAFARHFQKGVRVAGGWPCGIDLYLPQRGEIVRPGFVEQ
jgi:hypothetical protein